MVSYEGMSDFEINKLVAIERAANGWLGINQSPKSDSEIVVTTDNGPGCTRNDYYDYCNNPSDAWPIIVHNKIWIQPDMVGDGLWHCYDCEDDHKSKHTNPLRAAMIVFLMIEDSNNGQL